MENILSVEKCCEELQGLTMSQVVAKHKDLFEGEGILEDGLHLKGDQRAPLVALKEKYKMKLESTYRMDIVYRSGYETKWGVAPVS